MEQILKAKINVFIFVLALIESARELYELYIVSTRGSIYTQ